MAVGRPWVDARALEPGIVQAYDHGNPACPRRRDHVCAQEEEVLHVDDVGPHLVQVALELSPGLSVPRFELPARPQRDAEPPSRATLERRGCTGGEPAARGEDVGLVPELLDLSRDRLREKFSAASLLGREPVHDVEDAH